MPLRRTLDEKMTTEGQTGSSISTTPVESSTMNGKATTPTEASTMNGITAPLSSPPKKQRIYYLDNMRTILTGLVLYQHAASAYGGDGFWTYQSAHHGRSIALIVFKAVNRSYLMATFFFLSGYFSAMAGKRRTRSTFLKDKFLRLAVPTLVVTFLGGPLEIAAVRYFAEGRQPELSIATEYWSKIRGVKGPVWYTALLFVFDSAYIALRPTPSRQQEPKDLALTRPRVLWAVVGLALSSFLFRLHWPIGQNFVLLSIRPGYVPQYLAFYVLGVYLSGQDPKKVLSLSLNPSLVAISLVSGLGLACSRWISSVDSPLKAMRGGVNFPALAYAFWHESTGMLIFNLLLKVFATGKSTQQPWGGYGKYSYAAFLVHAPVLVAFMSLLDGWKAGSALKTLGIGTLGVFGSWGVGYVTAKLPGWKRCVV
ncbi:hypothetical protein K490DRAFT_61830 [Saccharata proteae CBS 121410]|uniref:Acyltransferase 3 domain-containing protein n=1 Tax=Saccharata proteae CBS 121410 TaxID=1314787 RepID=A0A9P4I267_9PEZI|nr:hypothetical protein K490DRAFT_61830 [Saccharata proteae CBS 121410]